MGGLVTLRGYFAAAGTLCQIRQTREAVPARRKRRLFTTTYRPSGACVFHFSDASSINQEIQQRRRARLLG